MKNPCFNETQFIQLLAAGYTTKEIAGLMGYAVSTIDTYRVHLIRYHRCKNTANLISHAYQTGILLLTQTVKLKAVI